MAEPLVLAARGRCCKACLGCAHVMKGGKNKEGEGGGYEVAFFFFSFKEFATSASPSFSVRVRSQQDRGEPVLLTLSPCGPGRTSPRPSASPRSQEGG